MAKDKKKYNEDIDLFELCLICWEHKIKFAILMLTGLIVALTISFLQIPRFATDFYVVVGHQAFDTKILMLSTELQTMINKAELRPYIMPKFSTKVNKRTGNITFTIESYSPNIQEETEKLMKEIITKALKQQKRLAELVRSVQNPDIKEFETPGFGLSYSAIAEIPIDEILMHMKIIFGPSIKTHPNFFHNSFFGILVGFIIAASWIMISLLRSFRTKYFLKL